MKVYSINEKELDKFSIITEKDVEFKDVVNSLWNNNSSFPEWCFVIEENDKVIGRIGYWLTRDNRKEIYIFGLLLPWEREDVQHIGDILLKESLKQMKSLGTKSIEYRLDSECLESFQKSKKLYESIGMQLIQEKRDLYYRIKFWIFQIDYLINL
ncbi:MAG: GNAT family N-acetyltransferase [Halanaerobiales bacterium]|nr:GNAT family N-acetyltransferase [Halanaerobiales bacterium]